MLYEAIWNSKEFNITFKISREEAALQTRRHCDLTSASVSILHHYQCPGAKSMRLHQNTDADAEAANTEAQTSDLHP